MLSQSYLETARGPIFPLKTAADQAPSPGDSLHRYLSNAAIRRVEAKQMVFAEGDPAHHVYRIETGAVSLFKVLADGRRQILGFAYAGDLIGLGIHSDYVMNAQALGELRIRAMPRAALHKIAAVDAGMSFKLYQAISEELAATRDLMMTTGHRSACERVAGFLVALSRRNERAGKCAGIVELPMTRADIADFLGLTIETVSRTLTKLRARRLIDLPQSARVVLLDNDALQELARGENGH
ncbi:MULTISPECIES: helix-turn-helix domain-containing protein [Rhodomicrobium]|uniref:helix-turn-helix domain-containing protein n=1 Tax=Rhodomicrobium TaxID=1068 RepID=UPI000B4A96BD|nr:MULTISPECIES: helix-turn-helix domain-containing protein [Rhodomicrobium]